MTYFKSMHFSLLDKVHTLPDKCPQCGRTLIQVGNNDPFCQYCTKKKMNQRVLDKEREYRESIIRRTKTDVIKRSIIEDQSLENVNFDSFDTSVSDEAKANYDLAVKFTREYLNSSNVFNVFISGGAGRGKSHLAYSMLKYINKNSDKPVTCLFVDFAEAVQRAKAVFNGGDPKYSSENLINFCGKVDYLVIDDLGKEATYQNIDKEATNFAQNLIFGITQRRQDKNTIVTTNLTSKQLRTVYNDSIVSRLFKNLGNHIIKFTDKTPDSRRKRDPF